MNIFALDKNPKQAAQWHMDKHVVKMPLETCQMLCTVLNQHDVKTPYKSAYVKHPCTIWAGKSIHNFLWLCELGLELCSEYTYRYEKVHKCESVIKECINYSSKISNTEMTEFALAMPDEAKLNDAVESYRNYYIKFKNHIATWKKRSIPYWYDIVLV